jgi:hypothetical protein
MTSIIKVDNIQNQCGANIISESSNVITIGASGDTVTLAAGASQSGFGRSGSVNWDTTPKTSSPVTAVSGNGYFINTTSGAITVNLPSTPTAGDIVAIADYANTSATNNITVGRNGSNIDGSAIDGKIKINGQVYTLVYVDSTEGWKTVGQTFNQISTAEFVVATGGTILTCGDYKTHIFTGPGNFCVSNAGNSFGSNSVEYLVVAGGGGGGGHGGGGGGAGGFRQNYPSPTTAGLPVTATSYPISVGGGGAGGCNANGVQGTNSVFSSITSTGGGYGSGEIPASNPGGPGGSGGGGGGSPGSGSLPGGTGNTPPVSPPQGNNGGTFNQPLYSAGGGGGAGAVGGNATGGGNAGPGGVGSPIADAFFGPTAPSYGTSGPAPGRYFAGGGGGSNQCNVVPRQGTGGSGGGAAGSYGPLMNPASARAGTANTGGGAGGSHQGPPGTFGGAGGSGIVVVRYKFQ